MYQSLLPGPKQALIKDRGQRRQFYRRLFPYRASYKLLIFRLPWVVRPRGTVEAVGPEVTEVALGDRVAYAA